MANTRRRGETLEHAIYAATLAELTESGYGNLTMERIAARARTGKAALYRRWPAKRELVLDALAHAIPAPHQPDPDRSTRDNLLAALTVMNDFFGGRTGFPSITVVLEVLHDAGLRLAFTDAVIKPRLRALESILRDGCARGEVRPEAAADPLVVRTAPALILQSFLLTGRAPTPAQLTHIVDEIVMRIARP